MFIDYMSIIILALFALLIIQATVLVLVGRRMLGIQDPVPVYVSVINILTPEPKDPLPKVLIKYWHMLTGVSLHSFIKIAKSLNAMTEEESDSLNEHLDLVIKVISEFIKPVIVKRLTYYSNDLEEYKIKVDGVVDEIKHELDGRVEPGYYMRRLIKYNDRIGGDLNVIADIVIDVAPGLSDEYIQEQIDNRSVVAAKRKGVNK